MTKKERLVNVETGIHCNEGTLRILRADHTTKTPICIGISKL